MSFLDKLLGRSKQAAGDLKDDPEMRQEGMHQEAAVSYTHLTLPTNREV